VGIALCCRWGYGRAWCQAGSDELRSRGEAILSTRRPTNRGRIGALHVRPLGLWQRIDDIVAAVSPFRFIPRVLSLLIVAMLVWPSHVAGADRRNILDGFTISSWTRKDGLPTTHVRALTQDRAGYLWVGTDAGLYRFDGVEFVAWAGLGRASLPVAAVRTLRLSRDGSLWVGYAEPGGIARIGPDGSVEVYAEPEGVHPGRAYLSSFSEDSQGAIWVGRSDGLYRFRDNRWTRWSITFGSEQLAVTSTHVDARDKVIIGTNDGLFTFDDKDGSISLIEASRSAVRSIAADGSGRLWVTDPVVGIRLVGAPIDHNERGVGSQILVDHRGALWLTTIQGLWRLNLSRETVGAVVIEKATAATGLLADGLTCVFEDRDNNIWVGTTDGLSRLIPHKVKSRRDLGTAISLERASEDIWVGSVDELFQFQGSSIEREPRRLWFEGNISATHADKTGVVWVATGRGMFKVFASGSRKAERFGVLPLNRVTAITTDKRGALWLFDQDAGLLMWDGHRLEKIQRIPAPVHALTAVGDDVWASTIDGRLSIVSGTDHIRTFGAADGLTAGMIGTIYQSRDGVVWLGASEGLSRYSGGHFTSVRRSESIPFSSLREIVEDRGGNFWLGTEESLLRVVRPELDRAFSEQQAIRYALYDLSDGLAGFPLASSGNRRAVTAHDGLLWFVTHGGVTIIDPATPVERLPNAAVSVERIVADGRSLLAQAHIKLPSRTSRLEIKYSLLNLTSPLKTRFRYQLEGFDTSWIDAGGRREATYTGLLPRAYRFVVQADNNEGTWGSVGALDFSITPMFYQTRSFVLVSIAVMGASILVAWRLNIRRVRKEFALVLGERTRLSREIHDTLLQSLAAVALQCDAISDSVPAGAFQVKDQLVRLRREVEQYIRDTRESIFDLRSQTATRREFPAALDAVGHRVTGGKGIAFELRMAGTPTRLEPPIDEELFRIGQEAVLNAVRHAQCTSILVEVRYERGQITLRVCDNGKGFDTADLSSQSKHYGLITMKERAEAINGSWSIESRHDEGTCVTTVVTLNHS
jgi:signal transduction histidine kinase/ligand-binding sensor domain-containing protein